MNLYDYYYTLFLDEVVPATALVSCHVMSCRVMSCHVMSCHVMSCHVMSCHVMSCHVMLAQNVPHNFNNKHWQMILSSDRTCSIKCHIKSVIKMLYEYVCIVHPAVFQCLDVLHDYTKIMLRN